ncbi:uncharacterized protein LOC143208058 isoform X2 [Lasioglossum baleicum]|uniref:uncharacterized protein LOC143208058 isoform X2 n=1 Tax=Lasioglossum baleicum TaxID=434251 RepID=UPI003FCE3476
MYQHRVRPLCTDNGDLFSGFSTCYLADDERESRQRERSIASKVESAMEQDEGYLSAACTRSLAVETESSGARSVFLRVCYSQAPCCCSHKIPPVSVFLSGDMIVYPATVHRIVALERPLTPSWRHANFSEFVKTPDIYITRNDLIR